MVSHLEPDILECEVKWALGSITTNKAILKDDAVKVLHSICQYIWKTQHWPMGVRGEVKPNSAATAAAAAAKSLQSCPTLCIPVYGSPPGSAVPGILQARTLEWIAISFSNAGK